MRFDNTVFRNSSGLQRDITLCFRASVFLYINDLTFYRTGSSSPELLSFFFDFTDVFEFESRYKGKTLKDN
jgi:hypothetical protein